MKKIIIWAVACLMIASAATRAQEPLPQRSERRQAERPRQGLPPALAERLRQIDTDADGKISKDEAPPRLRRRFEALDRNGDGVLGPGELEGPARQMRPGPRGSLAHDENGEPQDGRNDPLRQQLSRSFEDHAPAIGEPVPNVQVYDASGEPVSLHTLLEGHYSVIVFGCLT